MDEDTYVKMTFVEKLMLDNTKEELAERYKQLVESHDKLRELAERPTPYAFLTEEEKAEVDTARMDGRAQYLNMLGEWCPSAGANEAAPGFAYRITPEPEDIEGDEITDEMLNGGRVPCEVRDRVDRHWVPAVLVMVVRPGRSHPFVTEPVGINIDWRQCRIKKSDIPERD